MYKPSHEQLCFRYVATARAVITSPEHIVPLPWIALAMREVQTQQEASYANADSQRQ